MSWSTIRTALAGQADAFRADLDRAGEIQRNLLAGLQDAVTGEPLSEVHAAAPVTGYEAQATRLEAAARTGEPLVANDRILAFEQTSGTVSAAKLIPITGNSVTAMQSAILPWLDDLLTHRPGIAQGRAFFAISPATRAAQKTPGGHPIGLPDAAWFGPDIAMALGGCLAVPPELAAIPDPAEWQARLLTALVAAEDLSFISIWSPSYLTALLEALPQHLPALSGQLPADRIRLLKTALDRQDFSLLWPGLKDLSCWTHGWAAPLVPALAQRLPQTRIQGKGLLATEAAVSIPLHGLDQPVLAPRAAVVEFVDSSGKAHWCDQVRQGNSYRLALSTSAGLMRYDLGDTVTVTGFAGQAPLLRFDGRAGLVSDLVGEKLAEDFVATCLSRLGIGPAVLVPQRAPQPHYVLCMDAPDQPRSDALEEALSANPHYAHARRIGQLGPLRLQHCPALEARYRAHRAGAGAQLSVLKLPVLAVDPDLLAALCDTQAEALA